MDRPEIILAPGPTPIPPEVLLAQGSPLVYHRGPGFGNIMRDVTTRLQELYRTSADVLLMTSSGTGGLESAVANCFSPGDEVFVPLAGFFADRFKRLAEAYGLTVHTIDYEWGTKVRPDDVARALAEHPVKAVLLTHSETSTGVIQPVEELARVANDAGAMVIVDVVSSLGAVPFAFDDWGIDVAIGGSQKALSASPGIAFAAISPRAWEASTTATNPRFYFDWSVYKTFADLPDPESPWTPAISVMQGLQAALRLYFQDGVDAAMVRHRMLSTAVKEGAKALGLDLFGEGLEDNWTVTAIRAPECADADTISNTMRSDFGCVIAPGQGPLKGKVFRIGHFGYFDRLDIIRGLAALEMTLEKLGHPVKRGAAVAAAETVFLESAGGADRVRVLVTEKLSDAGLELLRKDFQVDVRTDLAAGDLMAEIPVYDALIIRSATQVTAEVLEAASNLKVVARAGIGLDNVDVDAATRRGVMVVNAPQSNIISAAEQTLALMLAQARNIPQADRSLKGGAWERSKWEGVELAGKTMGLIGLGRVGTLVAQRAAGFGMRVIGYDPYVSAERAKEMGVDAMPSLEALLVQSDFVSIHLPRTAETEGLLGAHELSLMKPGARLINTARGGIVDEDALAKALEGGHLGGAALDVFATEPTTDSPLFSRDDVVVTPHLGASTREAQDKAGTTVAEMVRLALKGEFVPYAVNVSAGAEVSEGVRPFVPLAEKLGWLIAGLAEGGVRSIVASYLGRIAESDTRVLTLAILKGILGRSVNEPVSFVNAPLLAKERGLTVSEMRSTVSQDYVSLVSLRAETDQGPVSVGGTLVGPRNGERVMQVDDFDIEVAPAEHMVFFTYTDRPGIIGKVGTILGDHGINIATMDVGRRAEGEQALMCLTVDSPVPAEVLDDVAAAIDSIRLRAITLPA